MILATVGQVVTQAQAEYEAKYGRRKLAEQATEEQAAPSAETAPTPVPELSAPSAAPAPPPV
jgi:hypothetical protein